MLKEFREGVELMISGASDFTDKLLYTQPDDLLLTISFHPYIILLIKLQNSLKSMEIK